MNRARIGSNSEAFDQTLDAYDECEYPPLPDDYGVKFIYAQWYIKDYISSTRGMTGEEEGIYVRFLMLLYDRGKPIPDDDAFVARQLMISTRVWRRLLTTYLASGKVIARNNALTNERFELERRKRAHELRRSSESAKSRWAKVRNEASVSQGLEEVLPKFAGSLAETSTKLSSNSSEKTNEINEIPVKPNMPVIIQSHIKDV